MPLDELSVLEMMQLMNKEDQTWQKKSADEIPQITKL